MDEDVHLPQAQRPVVEQPARRGNIIETGNDFRRRDMASTPGGALSPLTRRSTTEARNQMRPGLPCASSVLTAIPNVPRGEQLSFHPRFGRGKA